MTKIETFYTGGGITLAEAKLDNNRYAVITTEAPEFLAIYEYFDNETTYLPEHMISSTHKDDLPKDLQPLYNEMLDKLQAA